MNKKIVTGGQVSVKDSSGAYLPSHSSPPPKKTRIRRPKEPLPSDINLTDLIDKNLLILFRETQKLMRESGTLELLPKDSAHSVRENLKLLVELRKKEKEILDTMTDEDIEKLIDSKL